MAAIFIEEIIMSELGQEVNSQQYQLGKKYLITTDEWFYAPDGRQYRAVYGTFNGIFSDTETLGIKTNARSTNWYLLIGGFRIAGCQIHYAFQSDQVKTEGMVSSYSIVEGKRVDYHIPINIYEADDEYPSVTSIDEFLLSQKLTQASGLVQVRR